MIGGEKAITIFHLPELDTQILRERIIYIYYCCIHPSYESVDPHFIVFFIKYTRFIICRRIGTNNNTFGDCYYVLLYYIYIYKNNGK